MSNQPRRVLVIAGSATDLDQCVGGLEYLKAAIKTGTANAGSHLKVISAHRNLPELIDVLTALYHDKSSFVPDVIVAGAGWSNALTGIVWALLRYVIKVTTPVIAVCFQDLSGAPEAIERDLAAYLSVKYVPGSDIVLLPPSTYGDDFLQAVRFAVEGDLPVCNLPREREPIDYSIADALTLARAKQAERTT